MQQHDVLEDGRLGDQLTEQSFERLLHALRGKHLGDQQVLRIGLDAAPYCRGPQNAAGKEPRASVPQCGQGLISASTCVTTCRVCAGHYGPAPLLPEHAWVAPPNFMQGI
jgi:hypothetical protein